MALKLEDTLMRDPSGKHVDMRVHVPVWQIAWGVALGIVVGAPLLALGMFICVSVFGAGLGGLLR